MYGKKQAFTMSEVTPEPGLMATEPPAGTWAQWRPNPHPDRLGPPMPLVSTYSWLNAMFGWPGLGGHSGLWFGPGVPALAVRLLLAPE